MTDPDFVVGSANDGDEELPRPVRTPVRRRAVLAATLVALVAGTLIARGVAARDHSTPQGVAASSALRSDGSVVPYPSVSLVPKLIGPSRILTGPRRLLPPEFRPAGCPADAATCATTYGLPDLAMGALQHAFPRAVLTDAVSLLAERTARFGPELVSRAFHAREGTADVSVYISEPDSTRAVSLTSRTYGTVSTTTSLRQSVPGFVVSVEVTQPAHNRPVAIDDLAQLANDDGLVEPQ